jgi:hypothetical protein
MQADRTAGSGNVGGTPSDQPGRGGGNGPHGQTDATGSPPDSTYDQARNIAGNAASSVADTAQAAYQRGQRYAENLGSRYPEARRYYQDGTRAISSRVAESPVLALAAIGAAAYGLVWMLRGQSSGTTRLPHRRGSRRDYPGVRSGKPLIESDRVEGTTVYDFQGNNIGTIKRVMIDKISGRAAYAVMSFGGFLGFGSDEYAIPWSKLHYDTRLEGYRTDITEDQLRNAPSFSRRRDHDWSDQQSERELHDYYRVAYYWIGM